MQLSNDVLGTMVIFSVELAVRLFLLIKVSSSYTVRDLKYKSDKIHEVILDGQQVKYPNFNKVITRIENLNGEVKNKNSYHKIRHKSWNKYLTSSTTTTTTTTEAGLFETYGDLDEDDYFESYEDNKVRLTYYYKIIIAFIKSFFSMIIFVLRRFEGL